MKLVGKKKSNIQKIALRVFLGAVLKYTYKAIFPSLLLIVAGCGSIDNNMFDNSASLNARPTPEGMCLRPTTAKEQFIEHVYPKTYCQTSDDCPTTYMCDRPHNVCEATVNTKPFPNLYLKGFFAGSTCSSTSNCQAFEKCVHKPRFRLTTSGCSSSSCPKNFECNQKFKVCVRN